MKSRKLGEICRPKQWKSLQKSQMSPVGYPVYGANGKIGFHTEYSHADPTILVGCRGSIGSVFISEPFAYATSNTMALDFLDTGIVDQAYLVQFLRWRGFRDITSGSSQPQLTRQNIVKIDIPLPSLEEQRQISAVLNQVDVLRVKRQEAISHFEALVQSIFHETFGRLEAAPRVTLSDVLRSGLRNGLSPSTKGDVVGEVLTLSAVTGSEFDSSQKKVGLFDSEFHEEQLVRPGQILICRGNGNKALVGKGKVVQETSMKVGYPDTIIAGDINASIVEPRFLQSAWEGLDVRGQIERGARTTNGTFKVNQNLLGSISFPLPSMNRQQAFAARIAAVEKLKAKHRTQLAELDELFLSLQDRAFKGEL